jgi:hypothetical protein
MPKRIAVIGVPFMFALSTAIVVDRYMKDMYAFEADLKFFLFNDSILFILYFLAFYKPSK